MLSGERRAASIFYSAMTPRNALESQRVAGEMELFEWKKIEWKKILGQETVITVSLLKRVSAILGFS